MKRRPPIGNDPLGAYFPAIVPPPARPRGRKAKISVQLPTELVERLRAAVVALSGPPERLTFVGLVEHGLKAEVERLEAEHNEGRPFPPVEEPLRSGRPIGSKLRTG